MSENLPAVKQAADLAIFDYGDDAGVGFENQTADDMMIPFIRVLQANSPQVEDGPHDAGDLFNTVTETVIDGESGMTFIPVKTQRVYVEWVPRTEGGGFVAVHSPDDEMVKKAVAESESFGKYSTPSGNDLVETFYIYAVVMTEDGPMPALIDITSKKIKHYKKWNMRLKSVLVNGKRPPLFAHQVLLKTWKDRNKKGVFYNVAFEALVENDIKSSLVDPRSEMFERVKEFRNMLESGEAKVAYDSVSNNEGSEDAPASKASSLSDDDIPF